MISTAESLLSIASKSAGLTAHFSPSDTLTQAKNAMSALSNAFSIYSTFKPKKIKVDKEEPKHIKNLKTAKDRIRVGTTITATADIFDYLSSMETPLIGGIFTSGLGIASSSIDIVLEVFRCHERKKKIKETRIRSNFWKQKMTLKSVQNKIIRTKKKHADALLNLGYAVDEYIEIKQSYQEARTHFKSLENTYHKAQGIMKACAWVLMKKEQYTLNVWVNKKAAKQVELKGRITQISCHLENLKRWRKVDIYSSQMQQFQKDKAAKWESKTSRLKQIQKYKECKISLKVIALIISIASLSLTTLLPPVLITFSVVSLALAVIHFGLDLHKKYYISPALKAVPVPIF